MTNRNGQIPYLPSVTSSSVRDLSLKQYWEDLSNLSVMIVVMNMEQIGSLILYLSTYTSLVNIIYFL